MEYLISACMPQSDHTTKTETETYDIYLVPPGEDPETCQSWLRMRNRDGRYNLMFEEWVTEGPFIISPRITFEVCCCASAREEKRASACFVLVGAIVTAVRTSRLLYRYPVPIKQQTTPKHHSVF